MHMSLRYHGEKAPDGHGYKVGPVVPPDIQLKPGDQVAVYYGLPRCYFTGTVLMYPKDGARLAVRSTSFVHAIEVIKDDDGLDKW